MKHQCLNFFGPKWILIHLEKVGRRWERASKNGRGELACGSTLGSDKWFEIHCVPPNGKKGEQVLNANCWCIFNRDEKRFLGFGDQICQDREEVSILEWYGRSLDLKALQIPSAIGDLYHRSKSLSCPWDLFSCCTVGDNRPLHVLYATNQSVEDKYTQKQAGEIQYYQTVSYILSILDCISVYFQFKS